MWDSKLVNDAIFFACKLHDGQKMKHPENMPYSAHFMGVAFIAIKYANIIKDINWNLLVCSAILHDTLEDTSATYEDIEKQFGKQIADGVLALTKNEDVEKEKQMADCIERIKKCSKEIAIVKMADRMFNIRDRVPSWSKEKQEAYKNEAKIICESLGFVNDKMKHDFEELIKKY